MLLSFRQDTAWSRILHRSVKNILLLTLGMLFWVVLPYIIPSLFVLFVWFFFFWGGGGRKERNSRFEIDPVPKLKWFEIDIMPKLKSDISEARELWNPF